jgi:hypothetical protein
MTNKEIFQFVLFFLLLIIIFLWFTFLDKYSLMIYKNSVKLTNNYIEEFISH